MDGVSVGGFDPDDVFINAQTIDNKMFLQFYKYWENYLDYGYYHRWWTTVYDLETRSYLPYKKDIYYRDDFGWDKTNVTYTTTQFDWFKLPDRCDAA